MRSVVFCYAAEDASLARELGDFLELNCPLDVSWDDGLIRAGYGLFDAVGRGLSANIVLVFLSPDSLPRAWKREEWEPAFFEQPHEFGSELVFLLARDCKFPPLFRRRNFFDLTHDRPAGLRAVKRWFMEGDWSSQSAVELPPECTGAGCDRDLLENLERRLADRPGMECDLGREVALAFAHAHKADFKGVFWLNCANRSHAGILGDTAHRLGLRLASTLERNRCELGTFCEGRRCLFRFEQVAPENRKLVAFQGQTSVVFIAPGPTPTPSSLADTAAFFSSWTRDTEACLSALGNAQFHLRGLQLADDDSWQTRVSLGSAMLALLKRHGRLAEASEVLDTMTIAMRAKGDLPAVFRLESEKNWILDDWGQSVAPLARMPLLNEPVQLSLEFG